MSRLYGDPTRAQRSMAATPTPTPPTGVPPMTLARVTLGVVVAVNLVILEVVFFAYGQGQHPVLTVAKFFGLHAAMIMMVQLTLVARIPWLDRRLGMDRLTAWHRWLGFGLFWTVMLHAAFVITGYATLYDMGFGETFLSLARVPAALLGMIAAGIMIVVVGVSIRYVRRRLPYETWHALHVLIYLALLAGLVHQFIEATTFSSVLATGYWWTLWTLVLGSLVINRFVVPVWRNAYHRFRVAAVVPEADNVVSVHVTGRHLDRLPARAGQFCIWRFPGHNRWWQANPFSLSAAPDGRSLRLTAKAAGATSAGLRQLKVGNRVFIEGPYGAFTNLHRKRDKTLLVAGGVGITPIRALLEESGGQTVVLYRAAKETDAVLLGELQGLAATRGAQVHLLTGRTGAGTPPNRPFDPANLHALVPDITEREVFVCGPPALTAAVVDSVRTIGVPNAQIHAERFGLG
ncbi:ferredoxin reductase family protein [Solwaraspora sp. WMMA2056]|uniref:ferredoxin reductase family protein n=1 Tax=Solwaraspora sp. WMMA2056 TaxID=3015161 RepID=UPI00259B0DEA|nr:ferredoxin reductase family protein [Solwaraspora sp. WMMA2056]WJK41591.1 ferredoxin reductase family protein [Solwaraspora sp. WMMA2056]